MQIQTNYNTPTYTGKVTMLTMFRNALSQAGRNANNEISEIKAAFPKLAINQERLGNTIELSYTHNDTVSTITSKILISKDGITQKETNNISYVDKKRKFKLISVLYEYYKNLVGKNPIKKLEIQSIQNTATNKVEEIAKRTEHLDGSISINVTSIFGRESECPSTYLAKNIHPSQAKKVVNENGDIVYIEKYLKQ